MFFFIEIRYWNKISTIYISKNVNENNNFLVNEIKWSKYLFFLIMLDIKMPIHFYLTYVRKRFINQILFFHINTNVPTSI